MQNKIDRVRALRKQIVLQKLDGFVVPLTDEHMSEYVGEYAQRLRWLTGFDGSAGAAVVLIREAAIFVDGRYTLQLRDQVDDALFSHEGLTETSVGDWLVGKAQAGDRIGYDPWLHTKDWIDATAQRLETMSVALIAVDRNPIDEVWSDRPVPSDAPLLPHPDELAGRSSASKREDVARYLDQKKATAVIVTALDSVAWLFNIRGRDVPRTPVGRGFAIVHRDGSADLFVDRGKVDDALGSHLGADVRVRESWRFLDALANLSGTVIADPATCAMAIFESLTASGATVIEDCDPCIRMKARKNATEIAGARAAHARDGTALVKFLHWFDQWAPNGRLDELTAAERLEQFRRETDLLRDLSFETISGAGPNGAIVHYGVSPSTNRQIAPDGIYLVDSGGQYADGTTDVTRTLAVGTPTSEMRDRFTRVLKGHIALATAIFPEGTCGAQLDALARQHLWRAGLDYAHGTGHGVGSYLSVHEGPQRIAPPSMGQKGMFEPLAEGMIVSNEPGYYKAGEYGIRIENLLLVVEQVIPGAEQRMLGFEGLTLAPISLELVEPAMLSHEELFWLNAYHASVYDRLAATLPDEARVWLRQATRAL